MSWPPMPPTYAGFGLHHVTTFAVWIDAEYLKRFGDPAALDQYGDNSAACSLTPPIIRSSPDATGECPCQDRRQIF